MNTLKTLAILALCAPLLAHAQNPERRDNPRQHLDARSTTQTHQLLQLQRSGRYAPREDQKLDGEVLQRIYQRYVESFGHAIPERYIEERFTE